MYVLPTVLVIKLNMMENNGQSMAEIMKDYEHAVLETAEDRFLIDYAEKKRKSVSSDTLKRYYPQVYEDCLQVKTSRSMSITHEKRRK